MADLIFVNAVVLTQDPGRPRADSLAVSGGRIVAVGSWEEIAAVASPGARRIDLGGRTVVPGFNDAHVHVWKMGHLLTSMLDLRGVRSIPALQRAVREAGDPSNAGAWVVGRGYNEAELAESRSPTRWDLDEAAPDRPVYLTRTCGHIAVANSKAMALAGIGPDTQAPQGGVIVRDSKGEATGVFHETAMSLVSRCLPEPTAADYEAMILAAARHQLALGITSATDAGVPPSILSVYRAMEARSALPYRLNVMALRRPVGGPETLPLPERSRSDFLRVDTIKILADGGLSGATAALRAPYRHCEDCGVLRLDAAELYDLTADAHRAGLRVATHAIGDAAIDTVLDAYERLAELGACPWEPGGAGPRHRIEHFGLPHPPQLARAARLGVVVVPQAVFIRSLGVNFRRYLPDDLLGRAYPLREMLDAGLVMALSSDAPVVADDDPLLGIQAAVLRRDDEGELIAADQAISAAEALSAYTLGGALASGDAHDRGSVSVGKWADLTVLSDNPLDVAPEALTDIQVDMTWVGGALAFERSI
jgi:predicted amidohydrolase YtcJ